jgi:tripartite-type tricarboxylate transporter receptor subunit TctC
MCRILTRLPCLSAMPAQAAWPDRPITLIVPFGPGGGAGIAGRGIGRWLAARLGRPAPRRPSSGGWRG